MEEDKSRQINKVTTSSNKNKPRVELGKTFLHGVVRDVFSTFDLRPKG